MKEDRLKEWNGVWRWFAEIAEKNPSTLEVERDFISAISEFGLIWKVYRYGSNQRRHDGDVFYTEVEYCNVILTIDEVNKIIREAVEDSHHE